MRVVITGATGTIGLAMADALRARGDQVVALSRDPERGQRVLGEGVEVHGWADPVASRRRPRRCGGPMGSCTCSVSRSLSAGAMTPSGGSVTLGSRAPSSWSKA